MLVLCTLYSVQRMRNKKKKKVSVQAPTCRISKDVRVKMFGNYIINLAYIYTFVALYSTLSVGTEYRFVL